DPRWPATPSRRCCRRIPTCPYSPGPSLILLDLADPVSVFADLLLQFPASEPVPRLNYFRRHYCSNRVGNPHRLGHPGRRRQGSAMPGAEIHAVRTGMRTPFPGGERLFYRVSAGTGPCFGTITGKVNA